MISAATAWRLAPNHWLDRLRHRAVADNLRRLLLKLRLATPATLRQDRKTEHLLRLIARAETEESAALRALAAIESQYRHDKKSKRLHRAATPVAPRPQRHDLAWLFASLSCFSWLRQR